MTSRERRDLAASIRQRLLNLARERNEDFQFLLVRPLRMTVASR